MPDTDPATGFRYDFLTNPPIALPARPSFSGSRLGMMRDRSQLIDNARAAELETGPPERGRAFDLDDYVEAWRRLYRARARPTNVVYLHAEEARVLVGFIRGRNRTPLRLFGSYVVVLPAELVPSPAFAELLP